MIVIFSTHEDYSTQKVIEWLHFFNKLPIVINELNPIESLFFEMSENRRSLNFTLKNGKVIKDSDIDIAWYRRGLSFFNFNYQDIKQRKHLRYFFSHLKAEYTALTEMFFDHLQAKLIGDPNRSLPNKLLVLKAAKQFGLKIPATRIITTNTNAFKSAHVNKNIADIVQTEYQGSTLYNRTTIQSKITISKFFPSLLQANIEKYCELRIFHFMGSFFTMATLPEAGKKLKTDNRDITNREYLNRVSFTLPPDIRTKLIKLLKNLGYTTCSIDMIVDKKFNYYFLEINPVGQFGNLSHSCGFNIEKAIAQKLISYEIKKRKVNRRNHFAH